MINKWLLISRGTGISAIILIHFISCSSTLTSGASKDRRVHEVAREIFKYMYIKAHHHFSYNYSLSYLRPLAPSSIAVHNTNHTI